jgi:membrane protease YdiL (CAAX protease family)
MEGNSMDRIGIVRPMRLRQSFLFFMVPAMFAVVAQHMLWPYFVRIGLSEENAYNTAHLLVFIGLLLATVVALRLEGWPLRWSVMRERLRLGPIRPNEWKWTLLFLFLYVLLGYVLNILAQLVYQGLGFWPPDADVPLTNVPFLLVVLVFNVVSEELWWRGYILPRQELEHGKNAWVVNGLLWPFFHLFKWWAIPFLLLKHWMIPFIAQRTKNTTPALIIHFVSNGLSVVLSVVLLLAK